MELNRELEKLLKKVEKPARYIGEEINSIKKEHADVRFGFAFPDTYDISGVTAFIQYSQQRRKHSM